MAPECMTEIVTLGLLDAIGLDSVSKLQCRAPVEAAIDAAYDYAFPEKDSLKTAVFPEGAAVEQLLTDFGFQVAALDGIGPLNSTDICC